ncbi:MAG: DnaB helicase C-terminal domain-containing protein [Coriobacteriia bacterium]|nr:DnaB helicase C-terminal domain-containing protein [Coriobacteriia bacterium]MCL2745478.1 DnaB helicase C-terminal domain-containing protein [Coriobacteriia bacterium]MCL2871209.1 DnaB helicase C-terminal domain-containing protein [Coriobacteriia bacterium]
MSLASTVSNCSDIAADIDNFLAKPPLRVPLGIQSLDDALNGGISDEFLLVHGAAGMGKTDLLIFVISQLAASRQIIFASYELGRAQIVRRLLSALSATLEPEHALNESELFDELNLSPEKRYLLGLTKNVFSQLASNLYILDGALSSSVGAKHYTAGDLHSLANSMAEKSGSPPVLLVDYAQIVPVEGTSLLSTDAIDVTSRRLARIAHVEGVPTIALSSVSKNADVRGSSHLRHDADIVIRLDLDCVKSEKDAVMQHDKRPLLLHIEKNRNGRSGQSVPVMYRPAIHHFGSW